MHMIFFDMNGVILRWPVPIGTTINAQYYKKVLQDKLRPAIRKKRPGLLESGILFHHDNAPVHTARAVTDVLAGYKWELLEHPRYSPDLAPCEAYTDRLVDHYVNFYTSFAIVELGFSIFGDDWSCSEKARLAVMFHTLRHVLCRSGWTVIGHDLLNATGLSRFLSVQTSLYIEGWTRGYPATLDLQEEETKFDLPDGARIHTVTSTKNSKNLLRGADLDSKGARSREASGEISGERQVHQSQLSLQLTGGFPISSSPSLLSTSGALPGSSDGFHPGRGTRVVTQAMQGVPGVTGAVAAAAAGGGAGAQALLGPVGTSLAPMSGMVPVVSLKQEMDEVQTARSPGIKLDQADFVKRTCVFKLVKGSVYLDVHLYFPDNYPVKISPRLTILSSNLDPDTETRVIKVYNDSCSRHVKQHINCVEPSLRQMLQAMERLSSSPLESTQEERKLMLEKKFAVEKVQQVRSPTSPGQASSVMLKYPTGSFVDWRIPFPRTCGARFCSTDRLVTFGVPVSVKKVHEESEVTPRALSDLIAYVAPPQSPWMRNQSSSYFYGSSPHSSSEGVSISSFYVEKTAKPRHQRHHHSQPQYKSYRPRDSLDMSKRVGPLSERDSERSSKRQQKVGLIKIYDTMCINPVSKDLAERYKLDMNDIQGTCEHNAAVAREISRMDLAQIWQLVATMCHPLVQPLPNPDHGRPFANSAFGRPLLKRILEHYGQMRDVQTMAMLCCIFWDKHPNFKHSGLGISGSNSASYMTRNPSRTSLEYNAAAAANQGEVTMATSSDSGYYVLRKSPLVTPKRHQFMSLVLFLNFPMCSRIAVPLP
ncbi:hypothetical protein RRG08_055426 [Elysia crispata]|uniref:Uncharacterized protein n=1 Tax=Elysia crispata TaxID=231223 RepID=A0AAE1E2M5_9GAST|nr:hypothetical protein RRG08_055426 [Elysia crispata]